ncbi:sister chromatid cohesion 1 protein 4-like isoform X2 [Actinidia eriantha]|uniref:sister chromatid cohesion 1 protein 4-like isoform X2 n=1 Tax=Actinidia eriantha TaxID=165200 RepID=UPI002584320F|nr:sister chromatid cohesion 1 protein 4-like isoform X2 [Actinidia eriantha]
MFYSQFILAKKGPLGTIWIAAHLERKLRKNQVADTDIGVSVDSILFPDVPIALRLSSHLLLGVVRIYSRKVNYLFDDCSEALLKIKQAFRSTAVDLPPEESTAPYHSITLPETFDLDDFELPDSDILQGNYVDHHVSTREQITLQDSMEGVVYSTTQFGLDERFGDGDTAGLDLDEEIFLNNVAAPGHAGVIPASGAEPHASVQPMIPLDLDKIHDGNGNSELEGLPGNTDFIEYAQAPSTPGLVEEPNLSKTQEVSACDDQLELGEEPNLSNIREASGCDDDPESEDHNITNFAAKENWINIPSNSDLHHGTENDLNPATVLGGQEIDQLKSWGDSTLSTAGDPLLVEPVNASSKFPGRNFTASDGVNGLEDLQNEVDNNNEFGIHSTDGAHADNTGLQGVRLDEVHMLEDPFGKLSSSVENNYEKSHVSSTCPPVPECNFEINRASADPEVSDNLENAGNMDKSCPLSISVASNIESPGRQDLEIPQHLNQLSTLNPGCDVSLSPHLPSDALGLCATETSGREEASHPPGASTEVQGEGCHETDSMKLVLEENQTTEPASCADIQEHNVISSDTRLENIDGSENSELPAPEKLLSVPEGQSDLRDNLLVASTPGKTFLVSGDISDSVTNIISGKKRSFTESTLTVQSLNSVESLGVVRSKRTKESVPDDDDLLSSILVGRRSSVLKMKSTPTPLEITGMKRPRSASRSCASKRKVLMDDSMVLHGDVIRQQLTNTEDIRRIRKKAPCTRPEIWMIQKEFLEDEIFSEPIFTGLSQGLVLLHSQTYDLSGITVSEDDAHNPFLESAANLDFSLQKDETNSLEAANDMLLSVEPNVNKETGMEGINESVVDRNDVEEEPPETQQAEDHVLKYQGYGNQIQIEAILDVPQPQSIPHEHSTGIAEIDIVEASPSAVDAVNPGIDLGVESASSNKFVLCDKDKIPIDSIVQSALLYKECAGDRSVHMDASCVLPDQKLEGRSVVAEENDDSAAVGGTESGARDEFLLNETDGGVSVEINVDMDAACYVHTMDANPSLAISTDTDRLSNHVVSIDQASEEASKGEQQVLNGDEFLAAGLEYDGNNMTACGSSEEPLLASSYLVELNIDVKNVSSNEGEHPGCQEADLQCTRDAEIAATDYIATVDHGDFDYTIDGHDTGFLNADDDDDVEEVDDSMPSAEQTTLLDNSGWSSRTRAVAKYLQVLFDKEAEHGRKVLPMDNLLVGKTRKEASRMFFEALVLKTKDYINVEQGTPFDNINIKPRVKLVKSEF